MKQLQPCYCLVRIDPHHPVINIDFLIPPQRCCNRPIHFLNFKAINISVFNDKVSSINWIYLFNCNSVDHYVQIFYDILEGIIDECVPKITIFSSSYPRWFPPELKMLNHRKKLYHRKYKTLGLHAIYDEFTELRAECKRLSRKYFKNYIESLEVSMSADPRKSS